MSAHSIGRFVVPAGASIGIFLAALDGGTYAATSRYALAIGVWAAIFAGLALAPWSRSPPERAVLLGGVLLAAFAALTGLSMLWGDSSAEIVVEEFDRVVLYLGVFVLAALVSRVATLYAWAAAIAAGLTAVALLALASRCFPDLVSADEDLGVFLGTDGRRLNYPINYWNALGLLLAFAAPCLLCLAASHRPALIRSLAVAPLPALVATLYLTSSRGATIAAALGMLAFLILTSRRWAALGALIVALPGSAAVVAVLLARPDLVEGPLDPAAAGQGRSATLLISLACLGTAAVHALLCRFSPRTPELGARARWALTGLALLACLVGLVAAKPAERFSEFKQKPTGAESSTVRGHFLTRSGKGRWELWSSAVDQFETRPVLGRGAGSYAAWWAEHGTLPGFIRDAHSLYAEVLGELGLVGLALLVSFLLTALAFGIGRVRERAGEERAAAAALVAVVVAFLFEAGVDWMWEVPAVTMVAIGSLGLLAGAATPQEADRAARTGGLLLFGRLPVAAVALVLIGAQAVPLLAQVKIRESQAAVRRGDIDDALQEALAARRIQPWAASPHLQLALVEEQAQQLLLARRAIQAAIGRDGRDWRLWLVRARIEIKLGLVAASRASLARARELNPRSALFAPT